MSLWDDYTAKPGETLPCGVLPDKLPATDERFRPHDRPIGERTARPSELTDAAARKALPLVTGVLDYFPDALLEVAHCSKVGNDQHNPGHPLHWAKEKSKDEADALGRHLLLRGKRDTDGVRHSAKVAWRALALLQREIDAEHEALGKSEPGPIQELGAAQRAASLLSILAADPRVLLPSQFLACGCNVGHCRCQGLG